MPEFVLNRDYTHRSLHGHVINFIKGAPTWVPPVCVREVTAFGADPVDGQRADLLPEDKGAPELPPGGDDRTALIHAGFDTLVARNQRGDFAANGRPSTKVLKELLGFEVTAQERDELWEARAAKASA